MSENQSHSELQAEIIGQVDAIVRGSEERSRPLEMDPARGELFELFVKADRAGLTRDESEPDLSADGLCAELSKLWGLKTAAQNSAQQQTQLSVEHLARMRSLWSVMRMWMEWTYAWQRYRDFH